MAVLVLVWGEEALKLVRVQMAEITWMKLVQIAIYGKIAESDLKYLTTKFGASFLKILVSPAYVS